MSDSAVGITGGDRVLLWGLCFFSVGITLLLLWKIVSYLLFRRRFSEERVRGHISFLGVCVLLLCSVWSLRFAVNYYLLRCPAGEEDQALSVLEQIFNSLIHALQTFSMDEGYTEYISNGKEMMKTLAGAGSGFVWIYGVYASVMNLAAPIAGGAIVFEILTSFFPQVQLTVGALVPWKRLYLFSELNARSLTLARSILQDYDARGMIVFADFDKQQEDEDSEMLAEAAALIGAVCVKTDLTHLRCRIFGKRTLFLMDDDELNNIKTLVTTAKKDSRKMLSCADVYLFADSTLYERVAKGITNSLLANGYLPASGQEHSDLPLILPVRSDQNLVFHLLKDLPLFEPLLPAERRRGSDMILRVTVFGIGRIGTEMLLDTYWCGQMLGVKTEIHVVSCEEESEFRAKLNAVNPELLHTAQAGDPILRINSKGEMSAPYCTLHYHQTDVQKDSVESLLEQAPELLDTHYFVIALGSDSLNIQYSEVLRREIGRYHIRTEQARVQACSENRPVPAKRYTVIAYAVYDAKLCDALNLKEQTLQSSAGENSNDMFLYAFGSLEAEYSVENIMMPELADGADVMDKNYLNCINDPERRRVLSEKRRQYYTLWTNVARMTHTKYKLFSAGLKMPCVFQPECSIEWQRVLDAYSTLVLTDPGHYSPAVLADYQDLFAEGMLPQNAQEQRTLLNQFSWLEHRRWTAFTRSRGHRHTDAYPVYRSRLNDHKNLDLQLHPCLVECDTGGMHADLKERYDACGGDLSQLDDLDYLDLLTCDLRYRQAKKISYDFKESDYPKTYLEKLQRYFAYAVLEKQNEKPDAESDRTKR